MNKETNDLLGKIVAVVREGTSFRHREFNPQSGRHEDKIVIDDGRVTAVGELMAYGGDNPRAYVRLYGTEPLIAKSWVSADVSNVRAATHEEEVGYWRARAERAEGKPEGHAEGQYGAPGACGGPDTPLIHQRVHVGAGCQLRLLADGVAFHTLDLNEDRAQTIQDLCNRWLTEGAQ